MPSLISSSLCLGLFIVRQKGFLYSCLTASSIWRNFGPTFCPPLLLRTHKQKASFVSMFKSSSRRARDLSTLNAAIDILDTAKDAIEILPVKGIFATASTVLTLVRVSKGLY